MNKNSFEVSIGELICMDATDRSSSFEFLPDQIKTHKITSLQRNGGRHETDLLIQKKVLFPTSSDLMNNYQDDSPATVESKIDQFMSSMLMNASELCDLGCGKVSSNNESVKKISLNEATSSDAPPKPSPRIILPTRTLLKASTLSNSDSHIPYRPSYIIKSLDYSTPPSTISSSSSSSDLIDITTKQQPQRSSSKIIIQPRQPSIHKDDYKALSSTTSTSSSFDIIINGSHNSPNDQPPLPLHNNNNNNLNISHLKVDQSFKDSSNNRIGANKMRDKVKARAPSTFGKSATILSMNPLGSLVVNDDGYYSHSPDPSKRPNPSSLKKHPTISRPSLTYHESFVSPINFKTNKIDTPRLRRECGWIPSTLRVSPSLLSESSDDRESSTCTDLTETIYDFHLLNQSVSSMNYLVETSSSCLSSLLERYSNARLVNAKKMTLISYNIRKIFSHSKASTKGSSLDFQVKKLDKIPTCFGMCLSDVQVFCEGETLPKCIHEMMTFLLEHGPTTDGIFRKNGVRSRIETLKNKCISVSPKDLVFYTENGNCLLDGSQVHDIADTLKQYFRELPGKLFTEKLSEFFVAITSYLPADKQKEALRYGILLMDDVHRYAALTLFSFLHKICSWSEENNMSAENLAVCFTPSLFHLNTESEKDTSISNFRLKRRKTIAMPSEQELKEYQSAQKALALMIRHYDELYTLPKDISRQIAVRNPFYVATLYKEPCINIQNLKPRSIEQCRLQLKEMIFQTVNDYGLDWASWTFDQDFCGSTIYYRKMQNSLPLIRISITIQATPHVIWNVLYNKKKVWQSQVSYTNTITNISSESDLQVVGYKKYAEQEAFAKKVLLFRTWRKDSPELQGGCLLGERSVKDCDLIKANPSNVFPDIITSCFLIMPNPDGISSRLNYIHRSDIKGHTSTYYNKTYPRIIANQIVQLSNYFSNPFIAATQYPLRASESEV